MLRYAVPMLLLFLVPVVFLTLGRGWVWGRYRQFGVGQVVLRVVVALPLLFSGVVLHLVRVEGTMSIVPPNFPDPRLMVLASGMLEILGAIGLFVPAWRKDAGFLLTLLMIAIFPANIFVAGKMVEGMQMPGIGVRTAMQAVYMVLILLASFGVPGVGAGGENGAGSA